jgi:hypothetical protein
MHVLYFYGQPNLNIKIDLECLSCKLFYTLDFFLIFVMGFDYKLNILIQLTYTRFVMFMVGTSCNHVC